jgi:hypothetical protein
VRDFIDATYTATGGAVPSGKLKLHPLFPFRDQLITVLYVALGY